MAKEFRIALLLACVPCCLGARGPTNWRIDISQRYTGTACPGLCVDRMLEISSDGEMLWQISDPARRHESPAYRKRLFIGRARAAKVFQAMAAVRPAGNTSDARGCRAGWHLPGVWDWTIAWNIGGQSTLLRSCDRDRHIMDAWTVVLSTLKDVLVSD